MPRKQYMGFLYNEDGSVGESVYADRPDDFFGPGVIDENDVAHPTDERKELLEALRVVLVRYRKAHEAVTFSAGEGQLYKEWLSAALDRACTAWNKVLEALERLEKWKPDITNGEEVGDNEGLS